MFKQTQHPTIRTARRTRSTFSLAKRRVWYADDGTPPAEQKPPAPEQPNSEAKFTQADIDRIISERVKRAEESASKKLLGDTGFESADALREALKKAKEREDAELSVSEKLQKQLEAAQKANTTLMEQMNAMQLSQRTERRNNAIIAAAQEAKAIDPQDVAAWAAGQSELLNATQKEDGEIDSAAVKKLIDAAKKAKPHFFVSGGVGSPSNAQGRAPKADPQQVVGKRPFGNL